MKALSIRRTVLLILSQAKPYAMPFEMLLAEVNRLVRPAISADELKKHLRALLDLSMVNFLEDDIDKENEDARRWLICDPGEATLKR